MKKKVRPFFSQKNISINVRYVHVVTLDGRLAFRRPEERDAEEHRILALHSALYQERA